MTAPTTCAVCHSRLIFIGSDTHPACEPGMAGEFRVDWPTTAKQAVLSAIAASSPEQMRAGLAVIEDYARRLPYLSANDVRKALHAKGVAPSRMAAVFTAAAKTGVITRDGKVESDDGATKGHEIHRYRSERYQGREVA